MAGAPSAKTRLVPFLLTTNIRTPEAGSSTLLDGPTGGKNERIRTYQKTLQGDTCTLGILTSLVLNRALQSHRSSNARIDRDFLVVIFHLGSSRQ